MNSPVTIDAKTADQLGLGLFRYTLSAPRKFTFTNQTLAKALGLTPNGNIQKDFDCLIADKTRRESFFHSLETEGRIRMFRSSINRQEVEVPIAITAAVIQNGREGNYIEGIVEDISGLLALPSKAHDLDLLQNFLDSMPDAIYFKDNNNRLIKVNKFYADGFNLTPEQAIGKSDFDFFPKEQAQKMFDDDTQILKTGQPLVGKIERTLLPNGTWNQVITTKVPMFDAQGQVVGTVGITRDMTAHANLEAERFSMVLNALAVLCKALEMRDPYTYTHTRFVAKIAVAIAKELKFDERQLMQIKLASELHDLGKISIPLDILIKPGRLSDLEFKLVQEHVENCYTLIKDIQFPFPLAEIIRQHHERLDGSGYPRQLKGEQVLLEARIIAVSDVLEAMTSHRPYREALGIGKAADELKKWRGVKYDPHIVDTALELIKAGGDKPFWQSAS